MMDKDSKIMKKLQDSQMMKALKEDVTKSTKFIATTTCMTCHEKMLLGEETCPECKSKSSNELFSVINAFLVVSFAMFLLLGFLRPRLWLLSIVSLLLYIVLNKLKTRILNFIDKSLARLKKS